ncbi:MAG: hypothetical protein ABH879_01595 [archaeon]
MKKLRLGTRLTPDQNQILIAKARAAGYTKTADYVRSVLFMSMTVEEKINKIYERVCKDGS